VDAIINNAAIESGHVKVRYVEVNLRDFINGLIRQFESKSNIKKISLKTSFKNSSAKVCFDEFMITRALSQLISRAMQATEYNGEVKISVDFPKSEKEFFCITIRNSGAGLLNEELSKIEKIFSENGDTADSTVDFPFVLVKSIIGLHHGKISINSRLEKGTDIKCTLPIRQICQ
ncbi:MAG: HAMP domain-containing histidine kinase, partial [Holosporales bacterium]|nr:HAMP domain-containing histidine kinase [Holosporales bacterium]